MKKGEVKMFKRHRKLRKNEVIRNTTDTRNIRDIIMNITNNIIIELMNMKIKKVIKKKLENIKVMNKN